MSSSVEERLHRLASRCAGLDDFGDPAYREGLGVFLDALGRDHGLAGDALLKAATSPVVGSLVGRLYARSGQVERPEHAAQGVEGPVFIIGLGRTGTTALHSLLALDEQFQGLESWLVRTPMVRPPRERWPELPEYQRAVTDAESTRETLAGMHWVSADDYDECQQIIGQTFASNRFGSQRSPLPTYDSWLLNHDLTPSFHYLAGVLRLVGLDSQPRRWLLKNPSHILTPGALLAAFPDAKVVVTHRDPVRAIPSVADLIWTTRTSTNRYGTVRLGTPEAVARRELGIWRHAVDRYLDLREVRPEPFLDVLQNDLHRDPLGVVARIYRHCGLSLDESARTRMATWADQQARSRSAHRYRAENFGLAESEIAETYDRYRRAYGFA